MKIQYVGHSCFLLGMGGVRIVTDPYGDIGLPMPRLEADIVTVSHFHYDHCNTDAVKARRVISSAGEYDEGGVHIIARERSHDEAGGAKRGKTLAIRFEAEGLSLLHLGDIGEPPSQAVAEALGRADILLLPVGGHYTIDAAAALRYVELLRPAFAIPMHFLQPGLTVDIAGAEPFLKGGAERVGSTVEITREQCLKQTEKAKILYMERSR